MSATPREIGTLIVVILKARNLPNKRHIGKQDPYCTVTLNTTKRRTKAIKRGGQHPEWDEEIRFTVYEDVEDELARTVRGDGAPPPPPPKTLTAADRVVKGGKSLRLACYADDPREPDLIGETVVDLTEVLTTGETDEWFSLMYKDKYCGEVYLELTFWSNEKPPQKSKKNSLNNLSSYGGSGTFKPLDESSHLNRQASNSSIGEIKRDALPPSLRASGSRAPELYVPPYEHQNTKSAIDHITDDFGELSMSGHPSMPSTISTTRYMGSRSVSGLAGSVSNSSSHMYAQGGYPSTAYDDVPGYVDPNSSQSYSPQPYHVPYEPLGRSTTTRARSRYSTPGSSGFVPISSSASSGFTNAHAPPTDAAAYAQASAHYPMSHSYSSSVHPHYGSTIDASISSGYIPPVASDSSFHSSQYSQHYEYPPYTPSVSAPPSQFQSNTIPPAPAPLPPQSAPPQPYHDYSSMLMTNHTQTYPTVSHQQYDTSYSYNTLPTPSSYDRIPPPPPLPSGTNSGSSRPLPQPMAAPSHSYPQPPPAPVQESQSYSSIPPPPAPPNPHRHDTYPQSTYEAEQQQQQQQQRPPLPLIPSPPTNYRARSHSHSPVHHTNLPQPPVAYNPSQHQALNLPPPPPLQPQPQQRDPHLPPSSSIPTQQQQPYYPGPPPPLHPTHRQSHNGERPSLPLPPVPMSAPPPPASGYQMQPAW